MKILITHNRYKNLGRQVSSHKYTLFKDSANKLILYFGILPWIVSNIKNSELHASKKYKLVGSIPSLSSFSLLWRDYDVFIDRNIFSLSTVFHLLISSIRFKMRGVIVKEWFWRNENIVAKMNNYVAKYFTSLLVNFYISYSKKSTSFLLDELGIAKKKIFEIPKPCEDYSNKQIDKSTLNFIRNRYFDEDKLNIVNVNRLVPFKGVDILIKAVKDMEGINLILVGDAHGDYARSCKELSKESKADITFTGRISSEEVVYFYRAADLYVQPNKYCPEEFEPAEIWGSVVDEAMSLELPVIVTTATGCADDLVKGKNSGLIVKQGDIKALRDAIQDFLDSPKVWEKRGQNARKAFLQKNERSREGYKRLAETLEHSSI